MQRIWRHILNGSAFMASILLLTMTVTVAGTIFFRLGGISAPGWVVQFSEYGLLWIPMLAAGWLLSHEKHVAVDVLYSRWSPRVKACATLWHAGAGLLLCVIMTWSGMAVVRDHFRQGIMDIQVIDTPKYLILSIIPIGFLLLSLEYGVKLLSGLKRIRSGLDSGT
jgi:TRAP-type mannitol/chloroaromatic compound transport system permease small subunit